MKKLQTLAETEKRRKRNVTIMSVLMLLVLVSSTLGFAFLTSPGSSHNPINNDISETHENNNEALRLSYNGQSFYLQSSKAEVDKVDVEISLTPADFSNKVLYLDISNPGIHQEISSTLGRLPSRIQQSCYGKCEENLPEKNCTSEDNLIVWEESTTNEVYQEDNCVFIKGDITAADALINNLFSQA